LPCGSVAVGLWIGSARFFVVSIRLFAFGSIVVVKDVGAAWQFNVDLWHDPLELVSFRFRLLSPWGIDFSKNIRSLRVVVVSLRRDAARLLFVCSGLRANRFLGVSAEFLSPWQLHVNFRRHTAWLVVVSSRFCTSWIIPVIALLFPGRQHGVDLWYDEAWLLLVSARLLPFGLSIVVKELHAGRKHHIVIWRAAARIFVVGT